MKHEDSPPSRKYVSPLAVDDSEFLYRVDSIYSPYDCSSIDRNMDTRSPVLIRNIPPHMMNTMISGYSMMRN